MQRLVRQSVLSLPCAELIGGWHARHDRHAMQHAKLLFACAIGACIRARRVCARARVSYRSLRWITPLA
jgi:hypothetical protein